MGKMLRDFCYKLWTNIGGCFWGRNVLWHLFAIALTYLLVISNFDWIYFESTRSPLLFSLALPAAILGFVVPILAPFGFYLFGSMRNSMHAKRIGSALFQAASIGWFVSVFYKVFTGRLQPEFFTTLSKVNISEAFNFGFFRHGIFWGWPSSHTTVAFAMTATLIALFPKRRAIVVSALLYAFYIGLGVSVTIHWFSDFAAGAIFGTVVGMVVGKSYREWSPAGAAVI